MSGASKKPKASTPKAASSAAHASPKVFDVMRPGRALATATSRPIITGHKPKVKDSVVVASRPAQSDAQNVSKKKTNLIVQADEPETLMDASKKVTLQPVEHAEPAGATSTPASKPAQPITSPAVSDIPTVVIDAVDGTPSIQSAAEATQPPRPVSAQHTAASKTQTQARETAPVPSIMNYAAPSSATPQKSDTILATTAAPIVDMSRAVISQHLGKPHRGPRIFFAFVLVVLLVAMALLFIYL